MTINYQSQFQQDQFLNDQFFKNKRNGVFVDIGAHDGLTLSNTYYFEKQLDWTGMCIEPLPKVFEQLKNNRNCTLVNGCAWKENTQKVFRVIDGYSEMLSGLVDTYPQQHIDRINAEARDIPQNIQDILVDCYDTTELLVNNKLTHIDLLSIDVEGSELDILSSIDYDKVQIDVILAENNYDDANLRSYLSSKGYTYVYRLAIDDIFIKNEDYLWTVSNSK